ncbi:ubiquitin-like-specific protease ESD4 [Vitis vinifera]|uniref:ubiquitin-like-specific protease ESD4 n=1 Tax=Vitis vinifera TaxID=29760 RepID=UPI0008FEB9FB|nr:ubiquitin-like-specific protease ESD4 [Vitis vinifera]|eukprot:XP_019078275.1 PREDICTED: ubiquitin-like-specific protease ESD4 [Vitis vinifera]
MNQKTWNKYILPEDDILIDYAMGLYLRPSLKWSEVDVIHVPINLRNTHWVLGVVHLRSRRIYIYDSLKSINKPNRLKTLITPITMLLPRILSATKYYGENGDPKGERVWDIERLNSFPQQTKDGDCGMFLFKFAEYLMHNHPMDTLTGERMDWFREKMVVELFFHKELPM